MWWSVRPHLSFPTVEIRISDAQPLQEEAISLAALTYALAARVARAIDDGEPAFLPTNREIEENFWRAIRWGLAGELIDLRTHEVRPARAAIEELIEWVQPVAEELGAAEYLTIPAANAAERQIARHEEGASLEEIYAEQVRREGSGRWLRRSSRSELTPEELLEHIRRMKVSDLLLSTISTVAQLGYAKLDPAGRDLEQAKLAIESLRAIVPVLEGSVPGGGPARLQPGDGEPPARLREGRGRSWPKKPRRRSPQKALRVRPDDRAGRKSGHQQQPEDDPAEPCDLRRRRNRRPASQAAPPQSSCRRRSSSSGPSARGLRGTCRTAASGRRRARARSFPPTVSRGL